jgi:mRNA interferase YafQ
MREIKYTTHFKRDYRIEQSGRRSKKVDALLLEVVNLLAADAPLPSGGFDQPLSGEWSDHRECHVRPDLVLIYRKPDDNSLELIRLGIPTGSMAASVARPEAGENLSELLKDLKLVNDKVKLVAWVCIGGASFVYMVATLVPGLWNSLPRRFTQFGPICKYLVVEPFNWRAAPDIPGSLELQFDGAKFMLPNATLGGARSPLSRPVILGLKNYQSGTYDMRITATTVEQTYRFSSKVKIFDDADYYSFDSAVEVSQAARTKIGQAEEISAQFALIGGALLRRSLADWGADLPACASLPQGISLH